MRKFPAKRRSISVMRKHLSMSFTGGMDNLTRNINQAISEAAAPLEDWLMIFEPESSALNGCGEEVDFHNYSEDGAARPAIYPENRAA